MKSAKMCLIKGSVCESKRLDFLNFYSFTNILLNNQKFYVANYSLKITICPKFNNEDIFVYANALLLFDCVIDSLKSQTYK